MTFREIADAVGVGEYTPLLDEVYASLTGPDEPACDISLIDSLQSEWDLFGEFYELVRAVAQEVNCDTARSIWVKVTAKYAMDHDVTMARKVPAPQPDGTVVTAMLPLYTLLPIMNSGIIHKSGLNVLGSGGYEDDEGSFKAEFREDEQNYYGYACVDSKVLTQCGTYSKTQWEVFLRPGEACLSIHIPSGTDISNEALNRYFAAGRQIARERYPEHNSTAIFGSSWILDPNLIPMVGPESKIAGLQSRFIKYPQKATGKECFSFVFGKPKYENYRDLPEQTSLQRKLKQLYLSGGCTNSFAGIVIE